MDGPPQRIRKTRALHPCPQCGKAFTKRSNMLIHARIHTGETPYVCKYAGCGRSYKWLSSINFHEGRCEKRSAGLAVPAPRPPPPPAAAEAARVAAQRAVAAAAAATPSSMPSSLPIQDLATAPYHVLHSNLPTDLPPPSHQITSPHSHAHASSSHQQQQQVTAASPLHPPLPLPSYQSLQLSAQRRGAAGPSSASKPRPPLLHPPTHLHHQSSNQTFQYHQQTPQQAPSQQPAAQQSQHHAHQQSHSQSHTQQSQQQQQSGHSQGQQHMSQNQQQQYDIQPQYEVPGQHPSRQIEHRSQQPEPPILGQQEQSDPYAQERPQELRQEEDLQESQYRHPFLHFPSSGALPTTEAAQSNPLILPSTTYQPAEIPMAPSQAIQTATPPAAPPTPPPHSHAYGGIPSGVLSARSVVAAPFAPPRLQGLRKQQSVVMPPAGTPTSPVTPHAMGGPTVLACPMPVPNVHATISQAKSVPPSLTTLPRTHTQPPHRGGKRVFPVASSNTSTQRSGGALVVPRSEDGKTLVLVPRSPESTSSKEVRQILCPRNDDVQNVREGPPIVDDTAVESIRSKREEGRNVDDGKDGGGKGGKVEIGLQFQSEDFLVGQCGSFGSNGLLDEMSGGGYSSELTLEQSNADSDSLVVFQ